MKKKVLGLIGLVVVLGFAAHAANINRANVNTNLDQTAAWQGGILPGTNDIAVFVNLGNGSRSNDLGSSTAWLGLQMPPNQSRAFTLNTTTNLETLTLGSSGIDMTNLLTTVNTSATINVKVDLGTAQTWAVAGASGTNLQRVLIVNGVVSGASGNTLTKSGEGVLTLAGGSQTKVVGITSNSPTLTMTNTSGIVTGQVITGTGIAFGTTVTAIDPNVSVTLSQAVTTNGASVIVAGNFYDGGTVLNEGTLNINGVNALGTGSLTINGGTMDNSSAAAISMVNNAAIEINSDFSFTGTQSLNMGSGAVSLGTNAGTSRTITANGVSTLTLAGIIADGTTATQLIKDGTGTLTLNGSNSAYSGGLVIKKGVVALGNTAANAGINCLAAGTGAITLGDAAGGDVSLSVGSYPLTNAINLASGAAGTKTIGNGTGATRAPQFVGAIALNGNDLILSQKSTANMTVSGGITGTGNLHLTNGAAGFIRLVTNSINNVGSITVSGSANNSVNLISASIGANVTTLTLDNSAELILSNANAYAGGTTISSGTLIGAADGAFGSGNVTVAGSATLTLTNGVLNDYINDAALLILNSSSVLNLGYTGADNVAGISIDGTNLVTGTYAAADLVTAGLAGAAGTGSLTIGGAVSYTLTGSVSGGNGTVSPTNTSVTAGGSTNFVITAATYYRIASLTTNGTPVVGAFDNNSTSTNFTWSNVQSTGALVATFTAQVANDPAGTPYWWLAQYGLTNFNTDAVADQDLDGLKAWQEYIAGTVPTNAADCLKVTQSPRNTVTWDAKTGRIYSVYWSTNLVQGFTNLTNSIVFPQSSYTNLTPNAKVNHYQVRVRLP